MTGREDRAKGSPTHVEDEDVDRDDRSGRVVVGVGLVVLVLSTRAQVPVAIKKERYLAWRTRRRARQELDEPVAAFFVELLAVPQTWKDTDIFD